VDLRRVCENCVLVRLDLCRIRIVAGNDALRSCSTSVMMELTRMGCGFSSAWWLKVRICCTRWVARSPAFWTWVRQRRRRGLSPPPEADLRVPVHSTENVVEIMGNSASERTDSLKLLGAAKLAFEPPLLGHIIAIERTNRSLLSVMTSQELRTSPAFPGFRHQMKHLVADEPLLSQLSDDSAVILPIQSPVRIFCGRPSPPG